MPKAVRELERQLEEMRHGMEWYPADEEDEENAEKKEKMIEADETYTGQSTFFLRREWS